MRRSEGFTLIELMVVVLLLGIVATLAVPSYQKSVESSRAGDAIARLQAIALANRLYYAKNNSYTSAELTSTHALVQNRAVPDAPWGTLSYRYYSCSNGSGSGCCSGNNAVACAQRRSGDNANWAYQVSATGLCYNSGGAPACPGATGGGGGGGVGVGVGVGVSAH